MTSRYLPIIAHVREKDKRIQTLEDHLHETSALCSRFSTVIGLPLCGKLLGLLHDLGKYSDSFQEYIRSITGLNGEAAKLNAVKLQGTIDHATSGAQYIWDAFTSRRIPASLAQVLSVVTMSHHSRSGMKDFIDLTGKSPFLDRLSWDDSRTHKRESLANSAAEILTEIDQLLLSSALVEEFKAASTRIIDSTTEPVTRHNAFSLLSRYLFSCLLDADRISTSDFENPKDASFRTTGQSPDWDSLLNTFEVRIGDFKQDSAINKARGQISDECRAAATRIDRLFTLQVPTGGGKTLASLRFALHRAAASENHRVDRIIYILPYTSILDQNAEEIRRILGEKAVLEHHSNLSEEKDTWRNRVLSENWDAPIVFTTSVQFLNSLFAAGTKSARRMHQLSNAILIFDEIQSLPIKTIHLFNNAINFLCQQGNATAVLCTATMPLLQTVDAKLGALPINEQSEIIQNKAALFKSFKRTEIINNCRPGGWSNQEIAGHALDLQACHQTVLIICNTKNSARALFDLIKSHADLPIIHLSTNLCPIHRRHKISQIRAKLNPENPQPLICISTQLIEAGVDLDFGSVIRSLAGLDSIIQAAGRCNRHGHREMGSVHILNFNEETLYASLKEIDLAQQITQNRIFQEYQNTPASFDHDLLSEKAINQYYHYHFHQRAKEMLYPCKAGKGTPPLAQSCSLLSLLSLNTESLNEANRTQNILAAKLLFKHACSTAAQAFQVIDAPTQGIIVPYDQDGHSGSKIIADLAACYTNDEITLVDQIRLHKQAQQYTVNAFPHVIKKLADEDALREIQPGEGIYYLDERYYHDDLGVTLEALSEQHFLNA
ncbi:MAG: CRISPR-associated helicase Cas3' [Terrimicrobiaceae bacterium]